jgi:nucleoside-triphosphatase
VAAVLLTGRPGCGKTTLIRRVIDSLGVEADGFYTQEVRGPDGRRRGFQIITLDGSTATLSSVDLRSPYRVGRYGVDLAGIDGVAVPAIRRAVQSQRLVVVDEIGKMELFSLSFRRAVLEALEDGRCLLGTILLGPHPFADSIKARPDVRVIELTEANRAQMHEKVISLVRACLERPDRPA